MGTSDKTIRIVIALVFLALYFTHVVIGTLAIVLLIFAVVFLLSSFISFCPMYALFGIRSNKKAS